MSDGRASFTFNNIVAQSLLIPLYIRAYSLIVIHIEKYLRSTKSKEKYISISNKICCGR